MSLLARSAECGLPEHRASPPFGASSGGPAARPCARFPALSGSSGAHGGCTDLGATGAPRRRAGEHPNGTFGRQPPCWHPPFSAAPSSGTTGERARSRDRPPSCRPGATDSTLSATATRTVSPASSRHNLSVRLPSHEVTAWLAGSRQGRGDGWSAGSWLFSANAGALAAATCCSSMHRSRRPWVTCGSYGNPQTVRRCAVAALRLQVAAEGRPPPRTRGEFSDDRSRGRGEQRA